MTNKGGRRRRTSSRPVDFDKWLREHGACGLILEWAAGRTAESAWVECPRGDWLLWYAAKAGVERRLLVQAAVACGRLVPSEAAQPWARGEGIGIVNAATAAAAAAYDAAYDAARAARAPRATRAAEAARKEMQARTADAVRAVISFPGTPRPGR